MTTLFCFNNYKQYCFSFSLKYAKIVVGKMSQKLKNVRRKALCIEEILDELLLSDDEVIDNVCGIPPEQFDGITDEEDIDDNVMETEEPIEKDMAGTFEVNLVKKSDCLEEEDPSNSNFLKPSTRNFKFLIFRSCMENCKRKYKVEF